MDKDSGLVHPMDVTAANVSDVLETPELLTGEKEIVYADSGYTGAAKRADVLTHNKKYKKRTTKSIETQSNQKAESQRAVPCQKVEHAKSSVRCKVEHVVAVLKGQLRY